MSSFSENASLSLEAAATVFSAVGSAARIEILLKIIDAGSEGLTISEIQQLLDIPASTLAHHLRFLLEAQLIVQEKHGRKRINRANKSKIEPLAEFIRSTFDLGKLK